MNDRKSCHQAKSCIKKILKIIYILKRLRKAFYLQLLIKLHLAKTIKKTERSACLASEILSEIG